MMHRFETSIRYIFLIKRSANNLTATKQWDNSAKKKLGAAGVNKPIKRTSVSLSKADMLTTWILLF